MASGQLGAVVRQIHRLFGSGSVNGLSEAQLLARFVERQDEAAFEALVVRFGPMVLGVCRQLLNDPHAAEDAFQATFLVLVRRARSIRDRELLGNWLYGVAHKVARRSRSDLAKRRTREKEGQTVAAEPVGDGPIHDDLDLGPVLHEELARLPDKYRSPMVLCFLDGRTCEEAAERLGWPVGTVKGRISRAKDLLRQRLSRRGVTASVALVAATLTKTADASLSPILLDQTVKAAMGLAVGGATVAAGLASASTVALAEGVNATMTYTKIKIAAAAIVGLTFATAGGAAATQFAGRQDQPKAVAKAAEGSPGGGGESGGKQKPSFAEFLASASLPSATASTKELASDRIKAAESLLESHMAFYESGTITIDRLLQSAKAYTDARVAAGAKRKALEDYVRLTNAIYKREQAKFEVGQGSQPNVDEAKFALTDAMVLLAEAKAGKAVAPPEANEGHGAPVPATTNAGAEAGQESDDSDGDARIMTALSKPISLPFDGEVPLSEVIKYIQNATVSEALEKGVPIYIDPDGLTAAEKTLESSVKISLEGIKLKTSLRLLLKQLGLGYYVKHGLIIITNLDDEDYQDITKPGWRERQAAAERAAGGTGGGGMGGGFR